MIKDRKYFRHLEREKGSFFSNVFPHADLTLNSVSLPTVHTIENRISWTLCMGTSPFLAYEKSIFILFFKFHKINLFFFPYDKASLALMYPQSLLSRINIPGKDRSKYFDTKIRKFLHLGLHFWQYGIEDRKITLSENN